MTRLRSERGAGLIVIIGVIGALAVLGGALATLTANVMHNTMVDRQRAQAFNVAEAGVDVAMHDLCAQWPESAGAGPDFSTTAWKSDFRSQFDSAEFPNPTTGEFIVVDYYDNLDPVDKTVKYDKGQPTDANTPDHQMYVEAQGGVGAKTTRVQVLVERVPFSADFPRGVALVAGGNLMSVGGGNNPKIFVEVAPPADVAGGVTSVHVGADGGGFIDDPTVTQSPPIVNYESPNSLGPDEVFSQALVDSIVALAKTHGRYFTSAAAADASPVDPQWSPQGGISGLTVIDDPAGYMIKGDHNSEENPGIFLLLGGGPFDYGSGGHYYGIVYVDGVVLKGHGSYTVHGMIVVDSDQDMRGTTDLMYNDNCIVNLLGQFTLTVQQVRNTWREISPV